MDITKYKSGFNLGYFFAELEPIDDLSKRIRTVLESNPKSDYSNGFSKGYFHGRAKQKNKERENELSNIQKNKERPLTRDR